ncbi:MAG: glutaredoxin family protein [Dokdonella sp.]|uniref:glutaredoxin family protein n=1 Tax=Dokdonella sp. TaxID=2291710 RepID=UPI0025B81BC1|nr:glutaredoxin family protein [Dokdonella sp.]MBZ0222842.1 glutaredoxin family protein [Dokdonella sp.]
MRLILFQRDDCPLCDQSLAVLAAARAPEFESVWIDEDGALEERYGTRVPVLRDDINDRELDWPFDAVEVIAFIATGIQTRA